MCSACLDSLSIRDFVLETRMLGIQSFHHTCVSLFPLFLGAELTDGRWERRVVAGCCGGHVFFESFSHNYYCIKLRFNMGSDYKIKLPEALTCSQNCFCHDYMITTNEGYS